MSEGEIFNTLNHSQTYAKFRFSRMFRTSSSLLKRLQCKFCAWYAVTTQRKWTFTPYIRVRVEVTFQLTNVQSFCPPCHRIPTASWPDLKIKIALRIFDSHFPPDVEQCVTPLHKPSAYCCFRQ
jgi:hypothetical protein